MATDEIKPKMKLWKKILLGVGGTLLLWGILIAIILIWGQIFGLIEIKWKGF